MLLTGDSAILDVARTVSRSLDDAGLEGAVIGGVAVVLHGHVRTTLDVDVYAATPEAVAARLEADGFVHDMRNRQWVLAAVPVHLVTTEQLGSPPRRVEHIEGVRTVSLADLLNMKLRTGTRDPLRAQDLADAIGLIRARRLDGRFAPRIDKALRADFKRLVAAVRKDRKSGGASI